MFVHPSVAHAIRSRFLAGDDVPTLAWDYDLPAEAVFSIIHNRQRT